MICDRKPKNRPDDQTPGVSLLRESGIDARDGLPEDVFLLVSSLTPIPNVDLLVVNRQNQVLLAWRDDPYCGSGWHIPGGCIRYGETMLERVHKTALRELGCDVDVQPMPIGVQDALSPPRKHLQWPDDRGHHISILFRCTLPEEYKIDNGNKQPTDVGYLEWFSKFPENFLPIHLGYGKVLDPWR